jgi:hypothetical protein
LRPRRVLLFSTPHARQRGWEENAHRMLEAVRGSLIEDFRIDPLPDGDLQAELSSFRQGIQSALPAATGPGFSVALDCTTGQGIFRILGYEFVRQAVSQSGCGFRVVFCDGDSGNIILAEPAAVCAGLEVRPIQFQFSSGTNPLLERFSMYGVSPTGSTRLWPHATGAGALQGVDSGTLLLLFDELCADKRLRAFFHSYWNLVRMWKQRQSVETDYAPNHMQEVVDRLACEFAKHVTAVRALRDPAVAAKKIHAEVITALLEFVRGNPANAGWLNVYLQDRCLRGLNRRLQQHLPRNVKRILRQYLTQASNRMAENTAVDRRVAGQMRHLIKQLREELDRLARAQGEDAGPRAISAKEHHAFRERGLDPAISDKVKSFLTHTSVTTADLFELSAGCAVARIVDGDSRLKQAVACVHQNVNFLAGSQAVCELDSLVMLQTGDIFAFEAKTHYENADRKKIEANIKQLRDFGGAYSGYGLVYPLTRSEVERLAQGDEREIRELESLGMSDVHKWAEHIRSVRGSRDQRIIGIDELERTLCNAARVRIVQICSRRHDRQEKCDARRVRVHRHAGAE